MSNEPHIKITVTIEPRDAGFDGDSVVVGPKDERAVFAASLKAGLPPGFGPIYIWPATERRTAPGLHPYEPTKWRDGRSDNAEGA